MTSPRTILLVVVSVLVGLIVGGTATAVATSSAKSVKVCTTKKGVVRSASAAGKCPKRTSKQAVSVRGPAGPRGATGARGAQGPGTEDVNLSLAPAAPPVERPLPHGGTVRFGCSGGPSVTVYRADGATLAVSGYWHKESDTNSRPVMMHGVPSIAFTATDSLVTGLVVTRLDTGESFAITVQGWHTGSACRFVGMVTR